MQKEIMRKLEEVYKIMYQLDIEDLTIDFTLKNGKVHTLFCQLSESTPTEDIPGFEGTMETLDSLGIKGEEE